MKTNYNYLFEFCIIFDFSSINYELLNLKIPLIFKILSIVQHFLEKFEI